MSFAIVYLRQNFSSSVIGVHRDVRKRRSISAYHKCSFLQVERSHAGTIRGERKGTRAATRLTRLNYYLTLPVVSYDNFLPRAVEWNLARIRSKFVSMIHRILAVLKFQKAITNYEDDYPRDAPIIR